MCRVFGPAQDRTEDPRLAHAAPGLLEAGCSAGRAAVAVTAVPTDQERKWISLDYTCVKLRDETVIDGTVMVIATSCQISDPRAALSRVQLHERRRATQALDERAQQHDQ